MVCTICGEDGHNARRCPVADAEADDDRLKRLQSVKRNMSTPTKETRTEERAEKSQKSAQEGPTNTDIMNRLDVMMNNMVMKDDLRTMRQEMVQDTKVMISEAVDPVKEEICTMKAKVGKMDQRLSSAEQRQEKATADPRNDVQEKVAKLESMLHDLNEQAKKEFASVFGGLQKDVSEGDAIGFLEESLLKVGAAKPSRIFAKGPYSGMLWAKFPCKAERDSWVERFRNANIHHDKDKVWSDEERPKKTVPSEASFSV